MAFDKMALNESLGDVATHFFKSGNVIRSKENESLNKLKDMLPEKGPYNTNLEYDLWYDMRDRNKVHGYVYTDTLAKFIYIRVGDANRRDAIMVESLDFPVTEEGESIFNDLAINSGDKYKLRKTKIKEDFVIFLPGGNIISDILDYEYVGKLIKHDGAKIKCHPLTPPSLYSSLAYRYGEDNIINKKYSGHAIMESAERVGVCSNSELGLSALCKNKELVLVEHAKSTKQYTYSAIYSALFRHNKNQNIMRDRLKRIFSCDYNGLIPIISNDPQQRIDNYFDYYRKFPHVSR